MRKIVQFRLTWLIAFVSLLAIGLAVWRQRERSRLAPLDAACERALVQWRCVKALYDVHGTMLAQDEAEARELYFHRRDAIEAAIAKSWWPGILGYMRRR